MTKPILCFNCYYGKNHAGHVCQQWSPANQKPCECKQHQG